MEIDPWRNKNKVKVLSVMDATIGAFLITLYVYYGISFLASGESLPRGALGPTQAVFLATFLAISVLAVNVVQIGIAVKLFKILKPAEVSYWSSIRFSKIWFHGNIFFVLLLFVKFSVLFLFQFGSSNALDYTLCFTEFLFRSIGWYFVKEFIDDLTAESALRIPANSFSMGPLAGTQQEEDEQEQN